MKKNDRGESLMPTTYIGSAELPSLNANVRVSLLGEASNLDVFAADHIKQLLAKARLGDEITLGRSTLESIGDMDFISNKPDKFWSLLSRRHLSVDFGPDSIDVTDHSTNGTGLVYYDKNVALGVPEKVNNETLSITGDSIVEPHDIALLLPLKQGLLLELRLTTY